MRFLRERRNCQRVLAMKHFSKVIEDLKLIDLPLSGGSFTWCGGLNTWLALAP